jgi:hypothetical protein
MSSAPPWTVVLVRVWAEGGGLRIRMLSEGTYGTAEVVVRSSSAAARQLADWLARFELSEDGCDPADGSGPPVPRRGGSPPLTSG